MIEKFSFRIGNETQVLILHQFQKDPNDIVQRFSEWEAGLQTVLQKGL